MVLRLHQHNIGYTVDGFYRSDDPTNSVKVGIESTTFRLLVRSATSRATETTGEVSLVFVQIATIASKLTACIINLTYNISVGSIWSEGLVNRHKYSLKNALLPVNVVQHYDQLTMSC